MVSRRHSMSQPSHQLSWAMTWLSIPLHHVQAHPTCTLVANFSQQVRSHAQVSVISKRRMGDGVYQGPDCRERYLPSSGLPTKSSSPRETLPWEIARL